MSLEIKTEARNGVILWQGKVKDGDIVSLTHGISKCGLYFLCILKFAGKNLIEYDPARPTQLTQLVFSMEQQQLVIITP